MVRLPAAIAVAGVLLLVAACDSSDNQADSDVGTNAVVANAPTEIETVPPDDSDDQATDSSDAPDDADADDQSGSDDNSATDDSSDPDDSDGN